ncbi:MAG: hypothetical protein ABFD44_06165, partial [Anaerolineaceae bacterium]
PRRIVTISIFGIRAIALNTTAKRNHRTINRYHSLVVAYRQIWNWINGSSKTTKTVPKVL